MRWFARLQRKQKMNESASASLGRHSRRNTESKL